jgi:hypothetical protein
MCGAHLFDMQAGLEPEVARNGAKVSQCSMAGEGFP